MTPFYLKVYVAASWHSRFWWNAELNLGWSEKKKLADLMGLHFLYFPFQMLTFPLQAKLATMVETHSVFVNGISVHRTTSGEVSLCHRDIISIGIRNPRSFVFEYLNENCSTTRDNPIEAELIAELVRFTKTGPKWYLTLHGWLVQIHNWLTDRRIEFLYK